MSESVRVIGLRMIIGYTAGIFALSSGMVLESSLIVIILGSFCIGTGIWATFDYAESILQRLGMKVKP